jgi:hypothetical protein
MKISESDWFCQLMRQDESKTDKAKLALSNARQHCRSFQNWEETWSRMKFRPLTLREDTVVWRRILWRADDSVKQCEVLGN